MPAPAPSPSSSSSRFSSSLSSSAFYLSSLRLMNLFCNSVRFGISFTFLIPWSMTLSILPDLRSRTEMSFWPKKKTQPLFRIGEHVGPSLVSWMNRPSESGVKVFVFKLNKWSLSVLKCSPSLLVNFRGYLSSAAWSKDLKPPKINNESVFCKSPWFPSCEMLRGSS